MKDSQKYLFEHSEVKVKLLSLYMERYLNILLLAKYINKVILFDLFCGEGIYEDGGKGSPIILLEAINNLPNDKMLQNEFDIYLNDIKPYKINNLKYEINERGLKSDKINMLVFSTNDYQKMLPFVVSKFFGFKKTRGFVFIDPYGYKEIRFSHIRELLKPGTTEVLLFLPTQFMFRFEDKGTPQSLIDFISELIPKTEWPKSNTGIEFIERLKEAFKVRLGSDKFVDTFIITRDKNQFFCLFFFTSHIYGFDRMLDAKWQIDDEEGRGWKYNDGQDLFSEIQRSPNTYKLEKSLREFLKNNNRTNAEVYEFTLHQGFLPQHTVELLKNFQNSGILELKAKDGMKNKKGAFYINYPNYNKNPDRINLTIK